MVELNTERNPKFLIRQTHYVVGVDIGQAADPTALCVIQDCRGVMDGGSDYERHTNQSTPLQTPARRYRVVHLERLPLGTPYGNVVRHVAGVMARPPLNGDENQKPADLVIDESGVGKAVADMFNDAGLTPIRITITGGLEAKSVAPSRHNVAKHVLISNLDALLHHDKNPLRFSKRLTESSALAEELRDFERSVGSAGRNTYSARAGKHDDLILCIAIGAWWASKPPAPQAGFGYYGTIGP